MITFSIRIVARPHGSNRLSLHSVHVHAPGCIYEPIMMQRQIGPEREQDDDGRNQGTSALSERMLKSSRCDHVLDSESHLS
jgi:hypothetical protein